MTSLRERILQSERQRQRELDELKELSRAILRIHEGEELMLPKTDLLLEAPQEEEVYNETALEALYELKEGNARFLNHDKRAQVLVELCLNKRPHAVVVACADSRVPPELVFDQGLGDLYVVRIAGYTLDTSAKASILYGLESLEAPLVVVMGHEGCEAVSAALQDDEEEQKFERSMERKGMMRNIRGGIKSLYATGTSDEQIMCGVVCNVHHMVDTLRNHPDIRSLTATRNIAVVGCYSARNGAITFFDEATQEDPVLVAELKAKEEAMRLAQQRAKEEAMRAAQLRAQQEHLARAAQRRAEEEAAAAAAAKLAAERKAQEEAAAEAAAKKAAKAVEHVRVVEQILESLDVDGMEDEEVDEEEEEEVVVDEKAPIASGAAPGEHLTNEAAEPGAAEEKGEEEEKDGEKEAAICKPFVIKNKTVAALTHRHTPTEFDAVKTKNCDGDSKLGAISDKVEEEVIIKPDITTTAKTITTTTMHLDACVDTSHDVCVKEAKQQKTAPMVQEDDEVVPVDPESGLAIWSPEKYFVDIFLKAPNGDTEMLFMAACFVAGIFLLILLIKLLPFRAAIKPTTAITTAAQSSFLSRAFGKHGALAGRVFSTIGQELWRFDIKRMIVEEYKDVDLRQLMIEALESS